MFKRLRDRISEEANKFPGNQLGNNVGKQSDHDTKSIPSSSTEDLITLSESPSVLVPHTSPMQFSIGEDEDGSLSEQSTPLKNVKEDLSSRKTYVPLSDIESGREDPPTLNLDSISQEQMLAVVDTLKARVYKYKNKYRELVATYYEIQEAKLKLENTLTEHQDKSLRRITELREQCQLEQRAKADLDANLRLMLEEKDSRISVLETQNNLLKSQKDENIPENIDSNSSNIENISALQEKVERLDHQLNQAKKTITKQTDQLNVLKQQNESFNKELEEKMQSLSVLEEQKKELELRMEESVMAMAETKKNMHEEMQLKERQLSEATNEADKLKESYESEKCKVTKLKNDGKGKVEELERQLATTEKVLEDEKQNLMQELNRGKSAALALMQQDCANKISAVEQEWKTKFENLQDANSDSNELREKLKSSEHQVQELNTLVLHLEKENNALKASYESHQTTDLKTECDTSLLKMEEKLGNVEKNYHIQVEELKSRIALLEKEVKTLQTEKENLQKAVQEKEKITEELRVSNKEGATKTKDLEIEVKKLQKGNNTLTKENKELIKMKDKINALEKQLKETLHSLQSTETEANKEITYLKVCIEEADKARKIVESEFAVKIKKLQEENSVLFGKTNHVESLKAEKEELNQKLKQVEQQVSAVRLLEKEKSSLENQNKVMQDEMKQLKLSLEEVVTLKTEMKELKEVNENLKKENSILVAKIEQLQTSLQGMESSCNQQQEEMIKLRLTIEQSSAFNCELDKLKEENNSVNEENKILKATIEEKKRIETIPQQESKATLTASSLKKEMKKLIDENSFLKTECKSTLQEFEASKALAKNLECEKESLQSIIKTLQSSKEPMEENLKTYESMLEKIRILEFEKESLLKEIASLKSKLKEFKFSHEELESQTVAVKVLEERHGSLRTQMEKIIKEKGKLEEDMSRIRESFEKEKKLLLQKNESLKKQVTLLQDFDPHDKESLALKEYLSLVKKDCEDELKMKEEDIQVKLKHLVKDFCEQMDIKDRDCDKMVSDLLEKNYDIEDRLSKEHEVELNALKQELFEKECALEEMRDSYEETIQTKEKLLKDYESKLKHLPPSTDSTSFQTSAAAAANESSDWDDTWVVPEEDIENSSPNHSSSLCTAHKEQIESLKEELSKSNLEVSDLKLLLGLSPPELLAENNNRRDSMQSIPEPTEFEYLKNIIYEYMMGKETVTLAKVIAAVLRFNDVQTQQVVSREEAKHTMK